MPALPRSTEPDPAAPTEPGLAQELIARMALPAGSPGAKLVTLAVLAVQHGLWDQGITALEQARSFHPDNVELLLELGLAYQHRRRDHQALDVYNAVIALDPSNAAVYAPLGAMLVNTGKSELAVQASRIGISLDPTVGGLYINLASALRQLNRPDEAMMVYRDLLDRHPDHAAGLTDALHLSQHLNSWDGYDTRRALMLAKSFRLGLRVPPFSVLTATDDPEDQRLAAQVWTERMRDQNPVPIAPYGPRPATARARKLRIGYLSNDFYNHATALLLVELLELRDRDRFEVIGYSTGTFDDGTLIRNRIIAAFDRCYDLKDVNDADAAKKIHEDEIDILIDLKGFTSGARTEIVARRPTPIQVNYLGYPGTMGARFIDYIIADPFVIPPGHEPQYDEKVVRLPHCYQPNDRKRPVWPEAFTRAECGLPDAAFVFCSFNAPYKITPEIYALWMRLLASVPHAVLWLLEGNATGSRNLHAEAARHGIDPARVVMAPKMVTEKHLARMRLGDLFLDSFPVTAHTTASDALWVGLPVLTCPGRSFVSRVAGSLLHAIGVPELVVPTFADYEDTAVALATDPARLAAFRDRIVTNRLTTPLFDSERYTRDYEAALATMVERMDAGLPVAAFVVGES